MKWLIRGYIPKLILAFIIITSISIPPTEISSDATGLLIEGVASWYAEFSPGIRPTTANMERFDHDEMTCAIWDMPFNAILEVTNVSNGKKVRVRVNDRGPAKRLHKKGRVIDLSMAAFREIEDLNKGLTRVRVKIVSLPLLVYALKNYLFFEAFMAIISIEFIRNFLKGINGIQFEKGFSYNLSVIIRANLGILHDPARV
ncbi:septal ring lytic transglycosylase RlpA family protein [Candidatus Omnitrophota bacterium]